MRTRDKAYNIYADIGVVNPEQMLRKARIVAQISLVSTNLARQSHLESRLLIRVGYHLATIGLIVTQ